MSTFTLRVTSSAVNEAGTGFGEQPDLITPSFWDAVITNSIDPNLPNGTYDAYCLHPEISILFSPTTHTADAGAGDDAQIYLDASVASINAQQISQINWLLAQKFTSDPKYNGQFNYGEVQAAIWEILGFTPEQYTVGINAGLLSDNGRQTVEQNDVNFLVNQSLAAVNSGVNVLPTDSFFTQVIDPEGVVQPLILERHTGKIGNYVWQDGDQDGVQDINESGVDNVVVELYDANGTLVATTKTGDDYSTAEVETGYYQFTGLKAGSYTVKFVAPADMALTIADTNGNTQDAEDSDANPSTGMTEIITLGVGESNQTIDAGLINVVTPEKASLGDTIFEDANGNGIQDDGETGIGNVTVNLKDENGNVIGSTTTDANGNYSFEVDPGTYSIGIVTPDGYTITDANQGGDDAKDSDLDPTTAMSGNYTLAAGENNSTIDGGLYKLAEIGDRVWLDANKNGVQDNGEAGVAGVKVTLLNANGNAVGSPLTTDANGNYLFTGLRPGIYSIQFDQTTLPAGHSFTAQDQGADDAADSDASTTDGKTVQTVLTSGESDKTWDAGIVAPEKASLGDYVWFDKNGNGRQDDGNTGMNGVTVNLLDSNGNQVATTVTANDASGKPGYYLFDNLMPGNYQVQFVSPAGFQFTAQDQGDDAGDSDADTATGLTVTTMLEAGENDLSWDAGLIKCTAKLGDRVWLDANRNGIQDDGEIGVADVKVTLVDAGADGQLNTADDIKTITTTDTNGNYLFEEVENGKYQILFDVPDNYTVTSANAGTDDSKDSDVMLANQPVNLIVNGSFEDPNISSWGVFNSIPGWKGMGDRIEIGKSAVYGVHGTTGQQVAELDAYKAGNGTGMYQDVQTEAGERYELTLDVAARKNTPLSTNTAVVEWNGKIIGVIEPKSTTFQTYTFSVTGTGGTDRLKLREQYGDDNGYGGMVDNVRLVADEKIAKTDMIVIDNWEDDLTIDAGLIKQPKASIGDRVWEDKNFNGIQDPGESGVAGVKISLYAKNSSGQYVKAQTTTDANGYYSFENLDEGYYHLNIDKTSLPSGAQLTHRDKGGDDAKDSDAFYAYSTILTNWTYLSEGEDDPTWDIGIYKKASIGDRVWADFDNGTSKHIQGGREKPLINVKVDLLNAAGQVVATTKTDSNGKYLFDDLDPGIYSLRFDKTGSTYYSLNYKQWRDGTNNYWVSKDIGDNDNIDSDVAVPSGASGRSPVASTEQTFLESGEHDRSWDAGITPIVIDLNNDGIQTVSRVDAQGAFDLFGNGSQIESGWISGDDGFLSIDSNGNGIIDDISELFGGLNKGDGFAKLAVFDSNGDGVVNEDDVNFDSLSIWQDTNGDHETDIGELISLVDAGIDSLSVEFAELPFIDAQGNLHLERSAATLVTGEAVDMTDVYFNVSLADAQSAGIDLPSFAELSGYDQVIPEESFDNPELLMTNPIWIAA